jgi:hypothetical protein
MLSLTVSVWIPETSANLSWDNLHGSRDYDTGTLLYRIFLSRPYKFVLGITRFDLHYGSLNIDSRGETSENPVYAPSFSLPWPWNWQIQITLIVNPVQTDW